VSDVFLSYAREDRPIAEALARQLEAVGYSVWWDRDIFAGTDFEQVIVDQLASALAVVVLWSPASVRSGWVRDEAATAMERGVLVPVLLAAGVLPPLGFRSVHSIPYNPRDPGELARALVHRVAKPSKSVSIPAFAGSGATGIGWVEGLALLTLAVAVAAFVWFTPR
jgi:hypothetical protein